MQNGAEGAALPRPPAKVVPVAYSVLLRRSQPSAPLVAKVVGELPLMRQP
ncbi:MAG: hypothetical protein IPN34_14690 [Planctomycetes bacterium]|nr:hypothetical protein [Planctomycetota bacterium]